MPFHILRRSTPPKAPAGVVLVLAASPEAAVDMGMRVRELGCTAIEPRRGESGREAIARLRPAVVMVQLGFPELSGSELDDAADAVSARMIVFGKQWPDVIDTAREHSALSLPIDAPAKMMRSAIQLAMPA